MTKKQAREEMVYLVYTSILLAVITKGCQDRNSHGIGTPTVGGGGAGTDGEAMEGCFLLACSLQLAQPAFL